MARSSGGALTALARGDDDDELGDGGAPAQSDRIHRQTSEAPVDGADLRKAKEDSKGKRCIHLI